MSESASYVNISGAADIIGKQRSALSVLIRDGKFPEPDEYVQGASDKLTPVWRRETVLAYGESVSERRAKYDPTKNA